MTLLEQLRKPQEVKRWFDQIGDEAANKIESLQRELVAVKKRKNECVIDLYRRLDLLDDLNLKLQQQNAQMEATIKELEEVLSRYRTELANARPKARL